MDLFDHVKNLKPMAEAIVYLAENVEEVSQIEDKLNRLRSDIAAAEERLQQIAKAALEHAQGAEQAKASMIEGQSKLEQMIESTRNEANRILQDAKFQAQTESDTIKRKFAAEHAELRTKISQANQMLAGVNEAIRIKKADHDAVQASIDSLKKRLEG